MVASVKLFGDGHSLQITKLKNLITLMMYLVWVNWTHSRLHNPTFMLSLLNFQMVLAVKMLFIVVPFLKLLLRMQEVLLLLRTQLPQLCYHILRPMI